jgi:hypothetical protein
LIWLAIALLERGATVSAHGRQRADEKQPNDSSGAVNLTDLERSPRNALNKWLRSFIFEQFGLFQGTILH